MEKLNKISDNPVVKFIVLILTLIIALGLDLPDLLSKTDIKIFDVLIYGVRIFALLWVASIIYDYWKFKQQLLNELELTKKRLQFASMEIVRLHYTARRNNEHYILSGGRPRQVRFVFRDRFDNEIGETVDLKTINEVMDFMIKEYSENDIIGIDSFRKINEKVGLK